MASGGEMCKKAELLCGTTLGNVARFTVYQAEL